MRLGHQHSAKGEIAYFDGEDVDLGGLRCLIAGDRYILIEFGRSMDLRRNLQAISFANRIIDERIDGVIETLPMFVSVLVHFDSTALAPAVLRDHLVSLWRESNKDKRLHRSRHQKYSEQYH